MPGAKNRKQNKGRLGLGAESNNTAQYSPTDASLVYPHEGGHNTPDTSCAQQTPRPAPYGEPMRYEKAETILRIALDMQGSAGGLSLEDIRKNYSDRLLSRRTADRLRDAVERLFPQLDQVNPG